MPCLFLSICIIVVVVVVVDIQGRYAYYTNGLSVSSILGARSSTDVDRIYFSGKKTSLDGQEWIKLELWPTFRSIDSIRFKVHCIHLRLETLSPRNDGKLV